MIASAYMPAATANDDAMIKPWLCRMIHSKGAPIPYHTCRLPSSAHSKRTANLPKRLKMSTPPVVRSLASRIIDLEAEIIADNMADEVPDSLGI